MKEMKPNERMELPSASRARGGEMGFVRPRRAFARTALAPKNGVGQTSVAAK